MLVKTPPTIYFVVFFTVTLFLFNIVLIFQKPFFQLVYPVFTQDDQFGWDATNQKEKAVLVVQQLNSNKKLNKEFFAGKELKFADFEITHLNDVSQLLRLTKISFGILFVLFFVYVRYLFTKKLISEENIQQFLATVLKLYVTVCSISIFITLFFWDKVFTVFHQLLFPPGSWMFPIKSSLIRLFPELFWQHIFLLILFLPLLEIVGFYIVVSFIKKRQRKNDTMAR